MYIMDIDISEVSQKSEKALLKSFIKYTHKEFD